MPYTLKSKKLSWEDTEEMNITTKLFTISRRVEDGVYDINNEDVGKFLNDCQFEIWLKTNNLKDEIRHLKASIKAGTISAKDSVRLLKRVSKKLETFTL